MTLNDFGVDMSALHDDYIVQHAPVVPGRTAHMDGDFFAYQVSFDEERTWDQLVHNLEVTVETFRLLACAEHVVLHLTANGGTKGGRYDQAMLREYQATRKGKAKPARLEDVRIYMRDKMAARYWSDREADDGMAYEQTRAIEAGGRALSVIVSKDKDLRIVQGLHLDFKTLQLVDVDGFGGITLADGKLGGYGPAFFWAQMLMGDPADNISGLPAVHPPRLNLIDPTKATQKWAAMAAKGDEKAIAELMARKPKPVGPAMAYRLLKDVRSDMEAWQLVADLYKEHGAFVGFTNYRDGSKITWQDACVSEARLLWMRTDKDASKDNWREWRT